MWVSRVPDWRPVLLKKFMLVHNRSETFADTTLEQSVGDAKDKIVSLLCFFIVENAHTFF